MWEYNSETVEFDGSEDENWKIFSSATTFFIELPEMKTGINIDGFCDCFYDVKSTAVYGISFGANNKMVYFAKMEKYATITSDWKTWLQSNPITVLYQTSEPTYSTLSESEQQALEAFKTYNPTTVFLNNQNCFMQIEYKTKYGGTE